MNKKRREKLKEAIKLISMAESITERMCDKEQNCVDNTPENLQVTDRYDLMERAVESLEEAADRLSDARELIEAAIQK